MAVAHAGGGAETVEEGIKDIYNRRWNGEERKGLGA